MLLFMDDTNMDIQKARRCAADLGDHTPDERLAAAGMLLSHAWEISLLRKESTSSAPGFGPWEGSTLPRMFLGEDVAEAFELIQEVGNLAAEERLAQ